MTNAEFGLKKPTQPEWEGPTILKFVRHPEYSKTKTARYRHRLEDRWFDFYAPLFLLDGLAPSDVPERLLVKVGKSFEPVRTIGFLSERRPVTIQSDVVEYEFQEGKPTVNSKPYVFIYEGQPYALYVPNSIFQGLPHPKRIYVQIGVLEEE